MGRKIVKKHQWGSGSDGAGTPRDEAATLDHLSSADTAERRASSRIRTVYRVAKVARDRVVGLWRVRNISDRGMMLRAGIPVVSGERLSIALSDNFAMDGKVIWSDGEQCGVEFDQPIDSAAVLQSLAAERESPGYRAPRLPVDMAAVAYSERGIHPVRINDVSQQGLGFTHDGSFTPGMRILVLLEDGRERRGVVRWSKEGHAGLQLIEPLPAPELEGPVPPPETSPGRPAA